MQVTDKKIAVYGAGAMGTVLGALLTKGGLRNVHLITRNKKHVEGMKRTGAKIVCEAENTEFTVKVQARTPEELAEQYDVVFLMTKQRRNAEILAFLQGRLSPDGIVCTTQNGLPEQSVAEVIGADRTYGGVASFGATFIGEGSVALTSKLEAMRLQVAGYQNDNSKTELLLDILSFAAKAIDDPRFAQKADDLMGARWSKLAINAAFSGLSVVTGKTFGEIAKGRRSRRIALGVLRECMDVAAASGVTLEPMQGHDMQKLLGGRGVFKTRIASFLLPIAMRKHKKLVSGMLKDIQNGRRCEIDYINGVVCKEGKKTGVPTPLCERIVEIAHGIENGLYEISEKNLEFFEI
ncbi:MAG: 2-dehydropantoate 2-reductase [Clostridia bacterium]|nr:2-dehydropantoate 2-reductase [Clostridia bacterium]